MRFTSAFLTVVLGLVGTASSAPMDTEASPDSLNARGLHLWVEGYKLPITYEERPESRRPPTKPSQEYAAEIALRLINDATDHFAALKEAKAAGKKIELVPTNQWEGYGDTAYFSFRLPECGVRPCEAGIAVTKDGDRSPKGTLLWQMIERADGTTLFEQDTEAQH